MAADDLLFDLINNTNNLNEPIKGWNKRDNINGFIISFLILTWICVGFRMYTRLRVVYAPGWDDLFVCLLLVSGTMGSICICIMTNFGLGEHLLEIDPAEFPGYFRLFYIANSTYCMSTTLIKLSLLFQYRRVFTGIIERRTCAALVVITAIWGIVFSYLAWVPCVPVTAFFDWERKGHCYGFGSPVAIVFYHTHLAMALTNMILDMIIIYLPVVSYMRGRDMQTTRLGFLVLFTLGSLVIGISIWRLATIVEHEAATRPTFDPQWYGPISIVLSSLEVDIATICASIPVFWPVLSDRLDRIVVTKEIKIERTRRFSVIGGDPDNEDVEMIASRSTTNGSSKSAPPLPPLPIYEESPKKSHYKDEFIAAQVDPLYRDRRNAAEVTAERVYKI